MEIYVSVFNSSKQRKERNSTLIKTMHFLKFCTIIALCMAINVDIVYSKSLRTGINQEPSDFELRRNLADVAISTQAPTEQPSRVADPSTKLDRVETPTGPVGTTILITVVVLGAFVLTTLFVTNRIGAYCP